MTDLRNAVPHGAALYRLGYILQGGVVDSFGRRWKFSTAPAAGGGPVNYFRSLSDLRDYIDRVQQIRRFQEVE